MAVGSDKVSGDNFAHHILCQVTYDTRYGLFESILKIFNLKNLTEKNYIVIVFITFNYV